MKALARTVALVPLALGLNLAFGQVPGYKDLRDFGAIASDGIAPLGVAFDSAGNMYGTTRGGGATGGGTVWEITAGGTYIDLHDFGAGADGRFPLAGVTVDLNGNLFGTASEGGANFNPSGVPGGAGMVWEITAGGTYSDLHDFGSGTDGYDPMGPVTVDSSGNLYGTASSGGVVGSGTGLGQGMVWEIASSGIYSDLHDFGGSDGTVPTSNVVLDSSGNLYGTTSLGGANAGIDANGSLFGGVLWEISTSGTYAVVHNFPDASNGNRDGFNPGMVAFKSLVLFGVTASGGANYTVGGANSGGILWSFHTSDQSYSDLHDFGAGEDGSQPESVLIDSVGDLFGTTAFGGANTAANSGRGGGQIWSIDFENNYNDLHDFGAGSDGLSPNGIAFDPSGNLCGATGGGGAHIDGMLFKFGLPILTGIALGPDPVTGGKVSLCLLTLSSPAPAGGTLIKLSSSSADATVPSSITMSAGEIGVIISINTTSYPANVTATITARQGSIAKKAVLSILAPVLGGVFLSPFTVTGGSSSTGTVSLTGPAPSGGTVVNLSSTSSDAKVPASITVPAGSASATFTVTTIPYSGNVNAIITARQGANSQKAVLTIDAPVLSGISLNPTTVTGGSSSTGIVFLNGPAPSTGTVVSLSSSSADATVPSSVTVTSGNTSASFTISTITYAANVNATITAHQGATTQKAVLNIDAATVATVSLNPTAVTGGSSSTGTVTLTGPAPSAGTLVTLSSSSANAKVPTAVRVAAGNTTATFTVTTTPTAANVTATITGKQGTASQSAFLAILPPILNGLTLNPTTVTGGSPSTGTVTLSGPAPSGGTVVSLSSSSSDASVPATVTVAAGSTTGTFTVFTISYPANVTATITAKLGTGSAKAVLSISAPVLAAISLNPTTVTGGSPSTGTVTLTGPASSGGTVVTLASSSSAATVPATVTVPAGQTTATFTVTTTTVSGAAVATIGARAGDVSQSAKLTITP